jgi:ABC-2 type transport system permease protein
LAWRLQYPLLLGWLVAYALMGTIIGSIINDLGDMLDTPQAQQMIATLGGSDVMRDAFITMEFSILAFITAAYGIAATRRLATEEADGHAEPILATAVSRTRFLTSHLLVALAGTALLTLAQGTAFALATAAQTGDGGRIGPTIGAALAYLPAIWITTGVVILLFGYAPRLTFMAWVLLVGFLLVSELGVLLKWPSWALDASPFAHVPKLPAADMDWTPLAVLLLIAIALTAAGMARFRRRDLATP